MKTEALIADLARDLHPVRRLPSPGRRLLRWLALAVPAIGIVVLFNGLRRDLTPQMADPRFVIELIASALTGLTAAWAALASTVPGTPGRRLLLPLLPAAVWLISLGEGCWREWVAFGGLFAQPEAWRPQCMPEILATGLVPTVLLLAMIHRGAPFRPGMTASLAALATASLASFGVSLFHPVDSALTALIWHFGAVVVWAAVMAVVGPLLVVRRS